MRTDIKAVLARAFNPDIYNMYNKVIKSRACLAGLLAGLFVITNNVAFAAPIYFDIEIEDGASIVEVSSQYLKVEDILNQQGIELGEYDTVTPGLNENIDDSQKITIQRNNRIVVHDSGITKEYFTSSKTYKEFFENETVAIGEYDKVNVDPDSVIDPEVQVEIIRTKRIIQTIEEDIPFKTVEIQDSTRPKGTVYETKGSVGKKVTEYEVTLVDGKAVLKEEISSAIVKMPVDKTIYVGTNTFNPKNIKYKRLLTCTATAYDLSFQSCGKRPGDKGYGITATGTRACYGTVAVDPSVIPLGSKLYIETADGSFIYGYSTALDTGGAIKGNKVDLFFDSYDDCMRFGRRTVNVYVLE